MIVYAWNLVKYMYGCKIQEISMSILPQFAQVQAGAWITTESLLSVSACWDTLISYSGLHSMFITACIQNLSYILWYKSVFWLMKEYRPCFEKQLYRQF